MGRYGKDVAFEQPIILNLFRLICSAIILLMAIKAWQKKKTLKPAFMNFPTKVVPKIPGAVPLIGHGFQISKDFMAFHLHCNKTYGSVFCIQLFKWKTVVVGNYEIWKATTAASEGHLSVRDLNATLPVKTAIMEDCNLFTEKVMRTPLKKSLSFTAGLIPIIHAEAMVMVDSIKAKYFSISKHSTAVFDLRAEILKFVCNSLTESFFGFRLDEEGFETTSELNSKLKIYMGFDPVVPQGLLKFIAKKHTRKLSTKLISILQTQVHKLRCDPGAIKTGFMSEFMDYKDKQTGEFISDNNISRVVGTLLYAGLEAALIVTNLMADLILNPLWLEEAKKECRAYMGSGDLKGLLDSTLLDALVWESIRLNANAISVVKAVTVKNVNFLGYNLGDADTIPVSPRLVFETAGCTGLSQYDPTRFYGPKCKELAQMVALLQFGAGPSFCSGKPFVICQIKLGLAAILTEFHVDIEKTVVSKQMPDAGLFLRRSVTAAFNLN